MLYIHVGDKSAYVGCTQTGSHCAVEGKFVIHICRGFKGDILDEEAGVDLSRASLAYSCATEISFVTINLFSKFSSSASQNESSSKIKRNIWKFYPEDRCVQLHRSWYVTHLQPNGATSNTADRKCSMFYHFYNSELETMSLLKWTEK